jgi:hypothetical protein
MDLSSVRQSMIDTVNDYRKNHPALSPNDDDRDAALLDFLHSPHPITSWSQVNALSGLYSRNFQAGLDGFSGPSGTFSQVATCTPFGQGIGWYYVSAYEATESSYASMTLMLFRKPIMTKRVAAQQGLQMNEASLWSLTGGYTRSDGTWQVLGDGTTDPNGSPEGSVSLDPRPGTTKDIYTCGLSNSSSETYLAIKIPAVGVVDGQGKTKSFGTKQPSLWSLTLTGTKGLTTVNVDLTEIWTDDTGKVTSKKPAVQVTLVTDSPGVWNEKDDGCQCACGLGNWYGSQPYYHMKSGVIGGTTLKSTIPAPAGPVVPSGWFDRQRVTPWAASSNFLCQLLLTWKLWLASIQPVSWLWGTIQPNAKPGEDPIAYTFVVVGLNTSSMVAGHVFQSSHELTLHRYNTRTGEGDLNVSGSLTLEATFSSAFSPKTPYPCAYKMEVDGKTYYLRLPIDRSQARTPYPKPWPPAQIPSLGAMTLSPLVPLITGHNIECHGYLYDSLDGKPAGGCFFEAMAFEPEPTRLARSFAVSGLTRTQSAGQLLEAYRSKNLTFKQAAPTFFVSLVFILLFLGIIVTIIVVPIVLVRKHRKKSSAAAAQASGSKPSSSDTPTYSPDSSTTDSSGGMESSEK